MTNDNITLYAMKLLCALLVLVPLAPVKSIAKDRFSEELLLQPLSSGHLSTVFKFTTVFHQDIRESDTWAHYDLFPRSLGEIISAFRVQELRLSLTQGQWRHSKWGHPMFPAPPGALVATRILPSTTTNEVDTAWAGLTSALAGLLCASLNTLDKTQAVEPKYSFQARGVSGPGLSTNTSHLRYGVLPKENLCTENLTPWKKLLPCKSKRGLSLLLNSRRLHHLSSYQSLSLTVHPICATPACDSLATELTQAISLVFDPAIYNKKPDMADWSIKDLFGMGVGPPCPLAFQSLVFVDVTGDKFNLGPDPPQRVVETGLTNSLRNIAVYETKEHAADGIKNIRATYHKPLIYGVVPSPVLTVSRHVVGTGQERGGIVANIIHTGRDHINVVYLDVIPWYLRLYLHTLRVTSDDVPLTPVTVNFVPGVDRERPYSLEVVLRLPPRSTTRISIDYEYSMLRWVEYPPDANHGFYVGAAVLTARLSSTRNGTFLAVADSTIGFSLDHPEESDTVTEIFTEILLVALPTPDFSMPYNVICLACTVIALAFGPLHNITTKTLTVVPPGQEEKSLLGKVVDKIKNIFQKKPKKESVENTGSAEEKNDMDGVNKDEAKPRNET